MTALGVSFYLYGFDFSRYERSVAFHAGIDDDVITHSIGSIAAGRQVLNNDVKDLVFRRRSWFGGDATAAGRGTTQVGLSDRLRFVSLF